MKIKPTSKIRRPQVAKHQPRLRDGVYHPVTVRHAAPRHQVQS